MLAVIISPYNARLGISQFWSVDFLPIINSNYTLAVRRQYQNYIDLLEKFFFVFFRKFYKTRSFRKVSIVYSHFLIRGLLFPTSTKSYQSLRMDLYFFDFNIVGFLVTKFRYNVRKYISRISRRMFLNYSERESAVRSMFVESFKKASPFKFNTSTLFRYNRQLLNLFVFLQDFAIARYRALVILQEYIYSVLIVLHCFLFFKRMMRIHRYFFGSFPLSCFVHLLFFEQGFNAKFIAFFIERKVARGISVLGVVNLIFKLARFCTNLKGLRIVCSGRIYRGIKGGHVIRHKGRFTFGSVVPTRLGFSMEYSEVLVNLYKGLCGFRIWVSHSIDPCPSDKDLKTYFPISLTKEKGVFH